jgi:ATP-dependent Clp protease adapter protein ClpS
LSSAFEAAVGLRTSLSPALPPEPTDVVFKNDRVTTMELVVEIMRKVFDLEELDAIRSMLFVHCTGSARLGPYTRVDAERRIAQGMGMARERGAPLWIETEPHAEVPMAWSE